MILKNLVKLIIDGCQQVPKVPIFIAGHSLGGVCAAILAAVLVANYCQNDKYKDVVSRPVVYTFGSPRVGDSRFAEFFNKNFNTGTHYVPEQKLKNLNIHKFQFPRKSKKTLKENIATLPDYLSPSEDESLDPGELSARLSITATLSTTALVHTNTHSLSMNSELTTAYLVVNDRDPVPALPNIDSYYSLPHVVIPCSLRYSFYPLQSHRSALYVEDVIQYFESFTDTTSSHEEAADNHIFKQLSLAILQPHSIGLKGKGTCQSVNIKRGRLKSNSIKEVRTETEAEDKNLFFGRFVNPSNDELANDFVDPSEQIISPLTETVSTPDYPTLRKSRSLDDLSNATSSQKNSRNELNLVL